MSQPAPSPYRLLQRRAKAAGLPANKSAKELAHLLAGEEDASAAAPATATSAGTVSDGGVDPVCRLWPDGLAGVSSQGIFNAIPSWVDGSKSPGTTSQVWVRLYPCPLRLRGVVAARLSPATARSDACRSRACCSVAALLRCCVAALLRCSVAYPLRAATHSLSLTLPPPPALLSQVDQLGLQKTLKTIGTLKHMYMSPNLVWLAMAISLYYLAPYDFEAAKEGLSMSW